LQRVGRRRRRRRRSRQSRERSPKTKLPYTPSRVHERRRFWSSDPVRAGTPDGDTQVATEFVFCLESIFHTNGSKHRTLCSTESVLGSEEPAAPDMKSHEIRYEKPLHAPSANCVPARRWFACCMHACLLAFACTQVLPVPASRCMLHACVFVCNAYSYALKCSLPRASMHTNAPGKCSFKTPF
jgi:hypothetical protein